MNRESKPEYVEPPALVLINESEFEYIPPFYYQAWFWLIVGILMGFLIGQHIAQPALKLNEFRPPQGGFLLEHENARGKKDRAKGTAI